MTSAVGTTAAANQGTLTVDHKPIGERLRSADAISRDLTRAVAGVRKMPFELGLYVLLNFSDGTLACPLARRYHFRIGST